MKIIDAVFLIIKLTSIAVGMLIAGFAATFAISRLAMLMDKFVEFFFGNKDK